MANTYSFGQIDDKIGIAKVMDDDMNITAMDNPNQASAFSGGSVETTVMQEASVAPAMDTNVPGFEM